MPNNSGCSSEDETSTQDAEKALEAAQQQIRRLQAQVNNLRGSHLSGPNAHREQHAHDPTDRHHPRSPSLQHGRQARDKRVRVSSTRDRGGSDNSESHHEPDAGVHQSEDEETHEHATEEEVGDDMGDEDGDLGPGPHPRQSAAAKTFVNRRGRLFVIQYGLWLEEGPATFSVSLEAYNPAQRFKDRDHRMKGQKKEILDILPEYMHTWIDEPWFQKAFLAGMSSQRSNTSTRLRTSGPYQCFGSGRAPLMRTQALRGQNFRKLIGAIANTKPTQYSTFDVPILHDLDADEHGYLVFDKDFGFLHPQLMRTYIAVIRGLVAAEAFEEERAVVVASSTMESKYGITGTTPGAIAGAAILTRWALSEDIHLQRIGKETGILYAHDFTEYLNHLTEGLRERKHSVLNVLREWDRIIFPNSDRNHSRAVGHLGAVHHAEIDRVRALLADDDVEEEEEDGMSGIETHGA